MLSSFWLSKGRFFISFFAFTSNYFLFINVLWLFVAAVISCLVLFCFAWLHLMNSIVLQAIGYNFTIAVVVSSTLAYYNSQHTHSLLCTSHFINATLYLFYALVSDHCKCNYSHITFNYLFYSVIVINYFVGPHTCSLLSRTLKVRQ